ncbi:MULTISPECIES: methyl-accepting chemotaxis protein [unclassified Halomonas]|uniref:methyl-accepting chemotaxis protein n=1 Tax=unclassified Halomonas TaxID=2609666 RepID=UPI002885BDFF|nr:MULTISPECIES: methyl-accepting chemotaxis protein [unclassified Halomonas]MDT0500537.1 methyl-accepting chemotaxis protein [Halomonas sp. PAR7]MDT0511567.1 methyl-accepting chemotaxis protein [Halomonas sp. LES1]MDT0590145.1 methyl-accepting chemotaxis protein [Halomonas sp. PAR8]
MRQLTMTKKLWGSLGIIWVGMICLVIWGAWDNRQTMLEERRNALGDYVDMAVNLVKDHAQRADSGELPLSEARTRAADAVREMTYDEGRGYIYIFNGDYELLAHPRLPVGTSVRDFQNEEGRYLFREFVEDVRTDDGVVDYLWAHASVEDALAEKSSLNTLFEPWGWYVGTGVYIDDIDAAFIAGLTQSLLALLGVGIPLSLLMGLVIRSVTHRLGGDPSYAAEVVRRIAEGNLDRQVKLRKDDQTSLLFDIERMRRRLDETIGHIHHGTDEVNSVVEEIGAGNDELATRTEQQAASLAETASSMEQLTATVRQNAEHAGKASTLAQETTGNAERGHAAMGRVAGSMNEINDSASRMSGIIDTIDSIAFQTNILALNASVEAARAGEHGRGFAVVAEEVRKLASRSSEAAGEIKTLIEGADAKVTDGTQLVEESGEIISGMVRDIQQLTTLIGEISAASEEQSQGIEQVNQAVTQMDQMTQQNAGLVQEHTQASQRLTHQSQRLRNQVAHFQLSTRQTEPGRHDATRPRGILSQPLLQTPGAHDMPPPPPTDELGMRT